MPPRITKRRTTTNLTTENNQNFQKTKLYGSPTTKELKKKHSSRPIGGAETGSWAERTHGKVGAGGPGWVRWQLADQAVPHCMWIKWEEQRGSKTDHNPRVPASNLSLIHI